MYRAGPNRSDGHRINKASTANSEMSLEASWPSSHNVAFTGQDTPGPEELRALERRNTLEWPPTIDRRPTERMQVYEYSSQKFDVEERIF